MITLHELILISSSAVMGFTLRMLLEIWANRKVRPVQNGLDKANEYARQCDLREAYRAGQNNPRYIEAPAPTNHYQN